MKHTKLTAIDGEYNDEFGIKIFISVHKLLVGSPYNDGLGRGGLYIRP